MTTKIRIKLPKTKSTNNNVRRTAEDVMLSRFKDVTDLTKEEKQLLRDYVALNKFREAKRIQFKDELNKFISFTNEPSKKSGFRPVKNSPKFSSHKKPRLEMKKIFVKNFRDRCSLEKEFEKYGIESLNLIENKPYAFITLRNDLDVSVAIRELNGSDHGALPGKNLVIERAKKKG